VLPTSHHDDSLLLEYSIRAKPEARKLLIVGFLQILCVEVRSIMRDIVTKFFWEYSRHPSVCCFAIAEFSLHDAKYMLTKAKF
jgi:hypothetical protein